MSLRALSLLIGALLAASPAVAGAAVQHVGSIVAENLKEGTLTIAEMGPWYGPGTHPVRREFHLAPSTTVRMVMRASEPGGFTGAFVEKPMQAKDLRLGDYATVTVEREAGKVVATEIEVIRPGNPMRV